MSPPPARHAVLARYSELSADRRIPAPAALAHAFARVADFERFATRAGPLTHRRQAWESEHFGRETVELGPPLGAAADFDALRAGVDALLAQLRRDGTQTVFAEAPAEDLLWTQALTGAGLRLIETRLHYHHTQLEAFNGPPARLREATAADIPNLRRVAEAMRNDFDRFHADVRTSLAQADGYLATYIENCVRGFCDLVLVPDEPGVPSDSFMAANLDVGPPELDHRVDKLLFSAVSSATNRGWYRRLVAGTARRLIAAGSRCLLLNTQAQNGAVLHVWESLGFKLGRVTHVVGVDLQRDGRPRTLG